MHNAEAFILSFLQADAMNDMIRMAKRRNRIRKRLKIYILELLFENVQKFFWRAKTKKKIKRNDKTPERERRENS